MSPIPLLFALLLPGDWNPKSAADAVLAGLINTSGPTVKGAHDAEFVCVGDRAYIVAEVNDEKPGEGGDWLFIYSALSIVNLRTMTLESVIPMARGEEVFGNATLPKGTCFVPRILQKDEHTLRCYFANEEPGKRQAQTWYLDFDLRTQTFGREIYPVKLKTATGEFPMQPAPFHADATAHGFTRTPRDYGMYLFDSFKRFDGGIYIAINNYPGGQNALARLNAQLDTVEVIGHYNEPADLMLTESSVNRLPDGTWMAIVRQEFGTKNYVFSTSADGRNWTPNEPRGFVPNGTSSKPTFDRFGDVYYLGWQEATTINGVNRSVFNIDISKDGQTWERKYRFETQNSFQYPSFHEHQGAIYLSVTQGHIDPSRKERIMFGKLELHSP